MSAYPPIAEHGIAGDLQTAAVVSSDGTTDWWCAPRFDATEPVTLRDDAADVTASHEHLQIMYRVDGDPHLEEGILPHFGLFALVAAAIALEEELDRAEAEHSPTAG